jgi:hypothetical protein
MGKPLVEGKASIGLNEITLGIYDVMTGRVIQI